ncbi:hypothetical protein [Cryptosporangium aurantiacum]|uniref:hypothetical protein n=1 Tax=Cryptosporangium aurantiacum TaxID=134849 RepID=UPI0011611314|nr:hypothetical protein [Cryptosporangium aurantiacum]
MASPNGAAFPGRRGSGNAPLTTWNAVAAHVDGERALRDSDPDVFMGSLEELVARIQSGVSAQRRNRRLERRFGARGRITPAGRP